MTDALLLKIIHVPDMITINEILDPIVLILDHTYHLTDAILDLDLDPVLIQETTILQDTLLRSDLLQDQDILDILDPAPTQETKVKNHSTNSINLSIVSIDLSTTLRKWLML